MKFPRNLLKASTFSIIFKTGATLNLILFNRIIKNVIDPIYLNEVVFYIYLSPIIILLSTFGLKTLISKNQLPQNSHKSNFSDFYFFAISFFSTLFYSIGYYLIFLKDFFEVIFILKFFCASLFISFYHLIISMLMGKKIFLSANFFGGFQLNGFFFGMLLNIILFWLYNQSIIISLEYFFNLILLISFACLFTIILSNFNKLNFRIYPRKFSDLIPKSFFIFSKNISEQSGSLDIIFIRFLFDENLVYLYVTMASFGRLILTPLNIFSPIIIPFVSENLAKKGKNNFMFLRNISAISFSLSCILFTIIISLFSKILSFYSINSHFELAFIIICFISLGSLINVFKGNPDIVLILAEKEKEVFLISLFSTIIYFLSLGILSPLIGLIGILLSRIIYSLTKAFLSLYYLKMKLNLTTIPSFKSNEI